MEFSDKTVTVNAGEFLIVPKMMEHRPNAKEEVEVMLFEPASTLNTGNLINEKTLTNLKNIQNYKPQLTNQLINQLTTLFTHLLQIV